MTPMISGALLATALVGMQTMDIQHSSFIAGLSAYSDGSYERALETWRPMAERGNTRAQYGLAVMYELGQGVDQSYELAARWYGEAAERQYAMARNNLGMLYESGLGVAQSYEAAMAYYELAAEQGLPSAQYNLALMYYEGTGVDQDFDKAAHWMHKAASQGLGTAKYNLAVMLHLGHGMEQDAAEAAKWYIAAIQSGAARALGSLSGLIQNKDRPVKAAHADVRQQPQQDAAVLRQVSAGDRVYVLKREGGWVAVLLQDKQTLGWMKISSVE